MNGRLLIDCDGVLGSFIHRVIDELDLIRGTKHDYEDVTQWELYDAFDVPVQEREELDRRIMSPGFCSSIQQHDGAKEALDKLRQAGYKIYCVTSPFKGPHWMYEREQWLIEHMGFTRSEYAPVHDKFIIKGDVLIDDKVENLLLWQDAWPEGEGILFEQPWNKHDERWTGIRFSDWAAITAWLGGGM